MHRKSRAEPLVYRSQGTGGDLRKMKIQRNLKAVLSRNVAYVANAKLSE